MYVHLGGERVIRSSELVAIFDVSIEKSSKLSKQFMANAHKVKNIEAIGEEGPKSVVITKGKVYYSPVSSTTLKKRARYLNE